MNIKLKIDLPKVKWDAKLSGVYKLQFDNGMFYIGSSIKLHRRAGNWKGYLSGKTNGSLRDMKRMRERIGECKKATFCVIEYVSDGLRDKEYGHIKKNIDNPLMLNTFSFEKKPIIEYDLNGKEIKRWGSATEAARVKGVTLGRIKEVLCGGRNFHLGSVYKYQNQEDFYFKKRWQRHSVEKKIRVLRFTKDGEPAGEFFTTVAAAKATGVNKKGVYNALVGNNKTAGGYVFKYADL